MKKLLLIGFIGIVSFQSQAQSSLKLVVPIGHTRSITTMAITPDDKLILSGAADNMIHLWSVDGGRLLKTYRGHNHPITTIVISKSGKYFLSLDNDRKGFIREIATGALQDSVLNHYSYYARYGEPDYERNQVYCSNDVDGFGWIDQDNRLHFWTPGKPKIIEPQKEFLKTAISPDGKFMVAIGGVKSDSYYSNPIQHAYLITLSTGTTRFLRSVNLADGNQLGFSPDNSMVFVGDDGNAVFAYSTQTAQEVSRSRQSIWFTEFEVGKSGLLKLNCYDGPRLWNPSKNTIKHFEESDIPVFTKSEQQNLVALGAVFTQAAVDSMRLEDWWLGSRFKSLSWANNLFHLPIGDWGTEKARIEAFAKKSQFAYYKAGSTKPLLIPAVIAIKFNSKNWVARSHDKSIVITDLETNKDLKELQGLALDPPNHVLFSPDGKSLTYQDRYTRLWNFNQSRMLTIPSDGDASLQFVQPIDNMRLLVRGGNEKIDFLNADNGTLINTLTASQFNPFGTVTRTQVSNDFKFLVWTDDAGNSFVKKMNWENLDWYKTYRPVSDKILVQYSAAESAPTQNFYAESQSMPIFIPNRTEVFSAFNVSRYNTVTYLHQYTLNDMLNGGGIQLPYVYVNTTPSSFEFSSVTDFSFSTDGNRVLLLSQARKYNRPVTLVNWVDLKKVPTENNRYEYNLGWHQTESKSGGPGYYVSGLKAAIHPVKPWFAAGHSYENNIFTKSLDEDSTFLAFEGHTDGITSLTFSSDGKFLASTSLDNTVRIWDADTRQEVITLVTLGEKDWVVSHPSGLFDASPGAMNFIYFSTGQETIGLEQLKDRFYEPNLLRKVLGGESLRAVSGLEKIDLYPSIRTSLDTLNAKLVVTITDQGGGIGKTSVYVNAKEVVEDLRAQAPAASKGMFTTTIDLSTFKNLQWGDLNFIGVKAYNGTGYIASPVQKIYYQAPARQEHLKAYEPKLYSLVVGVSDYQNDDLDLKYSAKDAQDFAQAVSTAGKRLFGNRANVTVLTSDSPNENQKPIKVNIAQAMKDIASKAQIDDLVILYFSGHGTNLSGDDADFLYLTADARSFSFIDPAIRQGATISSSELTEFMKGIPAQKQVLIFDACASGRMVENMLAKRDVPSSTLRAMERMKDRTGTYILTGCAADAVSYEASQFGQGLLTYSLLSGMKGAALRDNKFVDVLKLFQYAKEEVPKLAEHVGGIQEPKVFSPYGGESFDIGLLEDTDKKLIPLTEAKPFLVRSSFQNDVRLRDDLGLSKLVDQALAERAFSGKNAPFIFVDSQEFPGAIYISGRYKIENGNTVLKVVLFKDDKLMGSLDKTLNSSDPANLQNTILEFVTETVAKK